MRVAAPELTADQIDARVDGMVAGHVGHGHRLEHVLVSRQCQPGKVPAWGKVPAPETCGAPMKYGIVLFTSDRGIAPAAAGRAAEDAGFDSFWVPEHTHIPVRREAAHPG